MSALAPSAPRSRLAPLRNRPVLVVLAVLVLLAVAIPLGLKTIHDASGAGGTSSADYPATGYAQPGVAPKAPEAARDSTGQGTSDAAGGAAGAPSVGGMDGKSTAGPLGQAADLVEPKLARSAWLGVRVAALTAATAKARLIATSAGGRVMSENIVTATDPTGGYGRPALGSGVTPGYADPTDKGDVAYPPVGVDEARMTLSVPEEKLDGVLIELSRLGTVSYRSSQTEDVTAVYIDTQARIESAQESVDQVRRLLTQAKDLQQIILLEQELNRRQADLDSLKQQLAALEHRTTMSDVTLTMWTDETPPAATENAFLDGLRTAWQGLLTSVTVIVTGIAALLPWLLVLGLLGWFGLRIYRRRSGGAPAATTTTAPSEASGTPPETETVGAAAVPATGTPATPTTPATPPPSTSAGPQQSGGGDAS